MILRDFKHRLRLDRERGHDFSKEYHYCAGTLASDESNPAGLVSAYRLAPLPRRSTSRCGQSNKQIGRAGQTDFDSAKTPSLVGCIYEVGLAYEGG